MCLTQCIEPYRGVVFLSNLTLMLRSCYFEVIYIACYAFTVTPGVEV